MFTAHVEIKYLPLCPINTTKKMSSHIRLTVCKDSGWTIEFTHWHTLINFTKKVKLQHITLTSISLCFIYLIDEEVKDYSWNQVWMVSQTPMDIVQLKALVFNEKQSCVLLLNRKRNSKYQFRRLVTWVAYKISRVTICKNLLTN